MAEATSIAAGQRSPGRGVLTLRRPRSEAALVRAAQAGSEAAVEELFARHWGACHRAALLITGDRAAAEDIAQEAFLAALRALPGFDLRRPLRPWLHRIVVNRAIDWSRARALRQEVGAEAVAELATSAGRCGRGFTGSSSTARSTGRARAGCAGRSARRPRPTPPPSPTARAGRSATT